MTENQEKLEQLLLETIKMEKERASAISESHNIAELALALIELWKINPRNTEEFKKRCVRSIA